MPTRRPPRHGPTRGSRPGDRAHGRGHGGRGRPARGQRGSVTLQLVVLMPVLFSVLFAAVQAAVWYHARTIAYAAAQEGAAAAAADGGTTNDGIHVAAAFVRTAGGDVLDQPTVSGRRSAAAATITVRGTSLAVVPALRLPVVQSATVPVERLTR